MNSTPTVLVVEDDPGSLTLQHRRLKRAGYAALTANSAEEAMRTLRREPIGLLVTDYKLSGEVDGVALYANAKAGGFDPPAILVTGYGGESVATRALRAGFQDYLVKSPDYLDRLAESVQRVLSEREPPRPLDFSVGWLTQVWEGSLDPMRLTDSAGTILRVNGAYCRLVGKRREELEGRSFSLGYSEAGRSEALARHREQFASGRCESLTMRPITLWDGRVVHLEFSSSFLDVAGRAPVMLSIIRDISQRVTLEERLRQAQKMDAIGQLAGGVAHDFNNLLTAIGGYSQLLYRSLTDDSHRKLLAEVIKAGDRASDLTRQLLAFSRKQVLAPLVLDLNSVVTDMAGLLRRLIGEDIALSTATEPGLWLTKADPGVLEQVLMNLAVNARDAMPRGGKLTIETRNVMLDEEYTRTRPDARPGPHVLLAVSDTGCGMTDEVKARLFEPFFTTKGERGTGLGLATVYGAVKQSGGHLGVYSELGRGSTFKIYLPRAEGQPSTGRSAQGTPLPVGGETVLVVEDDDSIRALSERVLQGCGYTVLTASDGVEALDVAARHPGPIDLLMTDVVMPHLGGGELAQRLATQRPGLRVLYLSGYTDDAVVRHGVLEQGAAFLHKPFSLSALARKVREMLDGYSSG